MRKIQTRSYVSAPLLALLLLPFAPLVVWSIANRWQYPASWPQIFGGQGWRDFFSTGGAAAVGHSFVIGGFVTLIVVPLSFMAAATISYLRGWRVRIFEGTLLLPVLIPPFVLVMGVTSGSIAINLPEDIGVVLTLSVLSLPYATYIFRSAFSSYGSAWEEEGELLGASKLQIFFRIRIPMLHKAILAAGLIAFLIGWSDYIVTLTVGGGQILSLPLLIGASASAPGNDSVLAVMSLISILIPVLLVGIVTFFTKKSGEVRSQ